MPISPLQLPDAIRPVQVDWTPLNQLGDAFAQNRKRQAAQEAIASSTNPDGSLDLARVVAKFTAAGIDSGPILSSLFHAGQLNLANQKFQSERSDAARDRIRQENAVRSLTGQPALPQVDPTPGPVSSGAGSWYSQYSGNNDWVDRGDKPGSNALGVPDEKQGIALPSRDTLGQWFDVTTPDGRSFRLQQTDVGPAKWTGRGVDVSAAAADKMGYSPNNFPTDQGKFTWRKADGPPPAQPIEHSKPAEPVRLAQTGQVTSLPVQAFTPTPKSVRDAEIDRLTRGMANPDLPKNALEYAKARLERLQAEKKAEEAPAQAGTVEASKERAKAAVKSEMEVRDAATVAQKSLIKLANIEELAGRIETGKTFPSRMSITALAKDLGVPDGWAERLGLKPEQLADAQAFTSLVNDLVVNKIGKGGFPANNFSDADRAFLTQIVPQLGDDPKAIKLKVSIARQVARRDIEKQDQWVKFRKDNPGKSYFDFEDDKWNPETAAEDKFGGMKREAQDLLGKKSETAPPSNGVIEWERGPDGRPRPKVR